MMNLSDTPRQVVHVVDDDETVQGIVELWLRRIGLETRRYLSAEEFRSGYRPAEVECVLLDLQLQGMSGLDLQAVLNLRQFQTPLAVISGVTDTPSVVDAMRGGAIDFLEKPLDEEVLVRAVRTALEKDRQSKQRSADLLRRLSRLSAKENEVLALLVEAKTAPEIAQSLSVSAGTVEKHRRSIFKKLDVENVPALIWLMRGLRR
jgi:two-component system, LuxR family, response regulator FixJ